MATRRRARSSAPTYVTVSCRCAVCDKDIPIARSPLPAATGRSNVIDVVALVGSATLTVGEDEIDENGNIYCPTCGRRVANVPYSGTLRKE